MNKATTSPQDRDKLARELLADIVGNPNVAAKLRAGDDSHIGLYLINGRDVLRAILTALTHQREGDLGDLPPALRERAANWRAANPSAHPREEIGEETDARFYAGNRLHRFAAGAGIAEIYKTQDIGGLRADVATYLAALSSAPSTIDGEDGQP